MVAKKLKEQIQYFLTNKVYMISLILAAIAGYGYEITHSSMSIDDVCIEIYFEDGLGVGIGRWPFYLINKLFHITDFQPFILEFVAVLFMVMAAILWSVVFLDILPKRLPIICYIFFSTMFIDYSLIAEVFIYYLQNGVAIIYCLIALSIYIFYEMQIHELLWMKKNGYMAMMSTFVGVAISFYESAANLFLFGILLVMVIDAIGENRLKTNTFKGCFFSLFRMARILIYGIIGRSLITKLCMAVFGIEVYNYRSIRNILWIFENPDRIIVIVKQILRDYIAVGAEFYPIGIFVAASVVYFIFVLWATVRKRNVYLFLVSVVCYGSIFILSIAQGEAVPYRSNQMCAIFVAAVLFGISIFVMKIPVMWLKTIGCVLVVSVIYNSAFDLNHWFVFEYEKNQIEIEAVHNIAYELRNGGYDIQNKPVVFVGEYQFDLSLIKKFSMNEESVGYKWVKKLNADMGIETKEWHPYVQVLSSSLIDWGIMAFSGYEGNNREIIRLFEKEGYTLIWGGNEFYQRGLEYMEDLKRYPEEGFIREYEDCIVVRF